MKDSINVIYMLILVIGTYVFILLLRSAQKAVLAELNDVLYRQNNVEEYLRMLQNKRLGLVLRKGSIKLLELQGYLYIGDDNRIQAYYEKTEGVRFTKGERLGYYQKKLDFSILSGRYEQARETYSDLEELLTRETDGKLKAILEDSKLLLGVYVNKDASLIPRLLSQEQTQVGTMQGITRYRLAKLYWCANDKQKALEYLELSESNLLGSDWEPIIKQTKRTPSILEKR